VIVEGLGGIQIAGTLSGATKPGNIHTAEVRQERRNRLSEKCQAALDEVYELAQNEDLARRNRTRAEFYILLSQLAHVNEMILRDASEEEILAEIQKLQEGQERFKEVIQKLEEAKQAKESDL